MDLAFFGNVATGFDEGSGRRSTFCSKRTASAKHICIGRAASGISLGWLTKKNSDSSTWEMCDGMVCPESPDWDSDVDLESGRGGSGGGWRKYGGPLRPRLPDIRRCSPHAHKGIKWNIARLYGSFCRIILLSFEKRWQR